MKMRWNIDAAYFHCLPAFLKLQVPPTGLNGVVPTFHASRMTGLNMS